MRRLAKNLILATAVVSAIFIVDLSSAEAANFNEEISERNARQFSICPEFDCRYLDFWSKFRDTVMPDPDEPQNNNPPKRDDEPAVEEPKPAKPPKVVTPKPAKPPKVVTQKNNSE